MKKTTKKTRKTKKPELAVGCPTCEARVWFKPNERRCEGCGEIITLPTAATCPDCKTWFVVEPNDKGVVSVRTSTHRVIWHA